MRAPTSSAVEPAVELRLRPKAPATVAGAALRAVGEAAGVGPERATRLRVLVEQLVTEARGRECAAADEDVVVRVVEHGGVVHVEVADHRLPVTAAEARRLDSRRLVALGFADHLHTSSHGADGNVAEVAVSADGEVDVDLDGEAVLDETVPRVTDEEAAAVEVRELRPADVDGLVRCVYRCYGYSYVDPLMYRPAQLRRAVRSGLLRSVVAVAGTGEVVGHVAMTFERSGDPVPEGGKLVVDPRFRGHHLAERLGDERRRLAGSLGLTGIWVECVTNHTFSQREVLAGGGSEVGLLIGAAPGTVRMADISSDAVGRRSLLAMFVPVAGPATDTVHVPARHAGLVQELAAGLGLDRDVRPDGTVATGATTLSTSVASDTGIAHVRLGRVGADVVDRVADEVESLAPFDLAVVHLDVPVAGAGSGGAVEALERLGFCFGAWLPGFAADGDVVRLQRIGSRPVDVDHVEVARDEGERIRSHVVEEWHRVRRGG